MKDGLGSVKAGPGQATANWGDGYHICMQAMCEIEWQGCQRSKFWPLFGPPLASVPQSSAQLVHRLTPTSRDTASPLQEFSKTGARLALGEKISLLDVFWQ